MDHEIFNQYDSTITVIEIAEIDIVTAIDPFKEDSTSGPDIISAVFLEEKDGNSKTDDVIDETKH